MNCRHLNPSGGAGRSLLAALAVALLLSEAAGHGHTDNLSKNAGLSLFPAAASICAYGLNTTAAFFGVAGGAGSVTVTSSPGCSWTAASNDPFVTITSGSTGVGSGTVSFAVASNERANPFYSVGRIATMSIAGVSFTISEEGSNTCFVALSPAGISFSNAAATGSIAIKAQMGVHTLACSWTAVSEDPWIRVSGGSTGDLTGTTTYTVLPNTTGSTRTGTMRIGRNAFSITQDARPWMAVDATSLAFSAVTGVTGFTTKTSSQVVRMTQTGAGTVSWIAGGHYPWVRVSPSSGTGSATLTISVQFADGLTALQADDISLFFTGAGNAAGPIRVTLATQPPTQATAPTGSFDTPIDGSTGVTGSIPVTGWAVDDVEIAQVRILRDPVAGEPPGTLVFIGDAVLVEGARPDVQALFPNAPRNTRAGWGYLLLTPFLPNLGNGTFRLTAIADDVDGHSTVLGSRTITCANNTATAPFGAIDTPAQGETISGVINNFGWVLSPGTRRSDPPGGGTVRVVIDGVIGAAPAGWASRADLASLFPAAHYSGIGRALGVTAVDTTALTNGLHTLSWLVTDNQGASSGIGSRYITVSNGSALVQSQAREEDASWLSRVDEQLTGRRGFDAAAPFHVYVVGADGRVTVQAEELDRIELLLGASPVGYLMRNGARQLLPIGSRIDPVTGTFTWHPGVGFVGPYDFVLAGRQVRIVLNPKGSNRVGPQVVIDTPTADAGGRTAFDGDPLVVAGWAADLDSTIDSGVDAVHVWAYPVITTGSMGSGYGDPTFIGSASYGGQRPDVAAVYGARFANSGYGIRVQGLAPGTYDIAVFAYSTVTDGFVPAKTVRVTVR